ncbi:MAG: hypoxanthine phosphoribosyltransferase [Magnetococcales bacterium]|nr:hypoxanthine phosphoribosyltransferase [Magnetococcales bacterium]
MATELRPRLRDGLLVVGIFKGAILFTADLIRALSRLPGPKGVEVDFLVVSSYGQGGVSSGQVELLCDCRTPVAGRQVLLIDDIIDTGHTLDMVAKHLRDQGAAEVITCLLLDKPERRQVSFTPDAVGFRIPDLFVVGYGLDFASRHRELPDLMSLHHEEITP